MSRHAPTIIDVAREAGVSPKTVSRVVNGNDYVSAETRQRVQEAIDSLNFRMNQAARSLASDRSATLGLVIPDVSNPYYGAVVSGVEQVANQQAYSVLLFNTNNNPDRELKALQILEEHRADGIIYNTPSISDAELRLRLQRQRAAVIIGHDPVDGLAATINTDSYTACVSAIDHLVRVNRRRIAFLTLPGSTYPLRERLRGFFDGMQAHGIIPRPDAIVTCADGVAGAFEATCALLTAHPETDAIIAYNDLLAYQVLDACDALGIRIPEQVAVVGFDDIAFSSMGRISLTTFRIPRVEVGIRAAEMLFRRMAGDETPAHTLIPMTFVQRGSTPPA